MFENSPMCFEEMVYQFGIAVATGTVCWAVQHLLMGKVLSEILTTPGMASMCSGPVSLVIGAVSLFAALFFLNRGAMLGVSIVSVLSMSLYIVPRIFESPKVGFFATLALIILVSGLVLYQMRKERN